MLAAVWLVSVAMADGHHHGEPVEAQPPVPRLAVTVTPDPVSGYNLHVAVENFRFAPEAAGGDHIDGQGHGHLYIDGVKTARLYGPWYHIAGLPPGNHDIAVTLNANDHRVYSHNGVPISATVTVAGPAEPDLSGYRIIDLAVVNGAVDRNTVRATQGEKLALRWTSDRAALLHLHGYDIERRVTPERPAVMTLEAFATGRFPITRHDQSGGDGEEPTLVYLDVHPQ